MPRNEWLAMIPERRASVAYFVLPGVECFNVFRHLLSEGRTTN